MHPDAALQEHPSDFAHHNDPEHIRKETRVYLIVFGALIVLTAVTVYLCFGLKMPVTYAIMTAMVVASLKGFLVAGFFMHLLSEKKLIYSVLVLTVVFFAVLLWGPWHHWYDAPSIEVGKPPVTAEPAHPTGH